MTLLNTDHRVSDLEAALSQLESQKENIFVALNWASH